MHVAALSTELDNIKIIPVTEETGKRFTISTLKVRSWYDCLVNKSVKAVNKDIKESLKKNTDLIFYPFYLGRPFYRKYLIFICTYLHYTIK
jgi:hypothetical protein